MIQGKVLRRHAGGYLVYVPENNLVLTCQLRSRLRKSGVSIFTGDLVSLEEEAVHGDRERGTGVIVELLERKNLLSKPYIANLDQVMIVQSVHQPEFNSLLCDRYLIHLQIELDNISFLLCINKCDLAHEDELETLRNIYQPLGYKVIFVSARTGQGLDELATRLEGKVTVFTGNSGVGKSSLVNSLVPGLELKVDEREELQVGRHTTTASELYQFNYQSKGKPGWIADTPGFSHSELKFPEPVFIARSFPEMAELSADCKYANCLHLVEEGCQVLLSCQQIAPSRYESYKQIVQEALAREKQWKETSRKNEHSLVKKVGGKEKGKSRLIPRLKEQYRAESRRKGKQDLRIHAIDVDGDETNSPDNR